MRRAFIVVALGATLAAAPRALALDGLVAALTSVLVAVFLVTLVSERLSALGVAIGALAALLHTLIAPESAVLAGAVLVGAVHLPRALRAESPGLRGAYALGAAVSGGVAAFVAARFAATDLDHTVAASLVAGVLAAAGLLVPVDDPETHAAQSLARDVPPPAHDAFVRAIRARRRAGDGLDELPRETHAKLERAWDALVAAARKRAGSTGDAATVLDARIAQYAGAIERAYGAAGSAEARSAALDDAALRAVQQEIEQMESVTRAMEELGDTPTASS